MNSKGHLYISLVKSFIRFCSAVVAIWLGKFEVLAVGFAIAEIGGVLEEAFDKR